MLSIILSPADHYQSLAPQHSQSWFFTPVQQLGVCDPAAVRNTPQVRSLLYQYMSAFTFSAIVEPLTLYVAIHHLETTRDAYLVVRAILISFSAFDVLHALATVSVTGLATVLPGLEDSKHLDLYASINFWVPLAWLLVRSLWFAGVGRTSVKVKSG
jgi:hypothetical protein